MTAAQELYLELISPIETRMKRTVARIVRDPDDAADTLQNALAQVWKNLKKIHHHPNPQACILGICINASYDTLRRRARSSGRQISFEDAATPDPPSPSEAPDDYAIGREKESLITAAVASLPPQQSAAVFLRLVEGESFRTIAQAIGCREATARSHVSKGKEELRTLLADLV